MDEGLIPMECDKLNSDPTINDVPYKPPECRDSQVHFHNAVKHSDEIPKANWRKGLILPYKYSANTDKLINMIPELETCEVDTLVRFKLCSTESKSRRKLADQFTHPHTSQGLWQGTQKRQRYIECSPWTVSNPCKRRAPHLFSSPLKGLDSSLWLWLLQLEHNEELGFVLDSTHGPMYRSSWRRNYISDIER